MARGVNRCPPQTMTASMGQEIFVRLVEYVYDNASISHPLENFILGEG